MSAFVDAHRLGMRERVSRLASQRTRGSPSCRRPAADVSSETRVAKVPTLLVTTRSWLNVHAGPSASVFPMKQGTRARIRRVWRCSALRIVRVRVHRRDGAARE
jgi:hypothetical protein